MNTHLSFVNQPADLSLKEFPTSKEIWNTIVTHPRFTGGISDYYTIATLEGLPGGTDESYGPLRRAAIDTLLAPDLDKTILKGKYTFDIEDPSKRKTSEKTFLLEPNILQVMTDLARNPHTNEILVAELFRKLGTEGTNDRTSSQFAVLNMIAAKILPYIENETHAKDLVHFIPEVVFARDKNGSLKRIFSHTREIILGDGPTSCKVMMIEKIFNPYSFPSFHHDMSTDLLEKEFMERTTVLNDILAESFKQGGEGREKILKTLVKAIQGGLFSLRVDLPFVSEENFRTIIEKGLIKEWSKGEKVRFISQQLLYTENPLIDPKWKLPPLDRMSLISDLYHKYSELDRTLGYNLAQLLHSSTVQATEE